MTIHLAVCVCVVMLSNTKLELGNSSRAQAIAARASGTTKMAPSSGACVRLFRSCLHCVLR